MAKIPLHEICHARSGDKGNTVNIGLIVYDPEDYGIIVSQVTATRVQKHFVNLIEGEVERYELPQLGALNFVIRGALDGGVSRSTRIDPFGKTFSSSLLGMDVEVER